MGLGRGPDCTMLGADVGQCTVVPTDPHPTPRQPMVEPRVMGTPGKCVNATHPVPPVRACHRPGNGTFAFPSTPAAWCPLWLLQHHTSICPS